MSVYGNTNSRAKNRRTGNCQTFCFACPALRPSPPSTNTVPKSILFTEASFFQMDTGITFGNTTQPFTIECWFHSNYDLNGNAAILGSGGTGTDGSAPFADNGLTMYNSSQGNIWRIDSSGKASQPFTLDTQMVANTWYYIVMSRDSSSYVQMWLGQLGNSAATASTSGRVLLDNATNWDFTSPTYQIGAWANTGWSNSGTGGVYMNNLRVTNTSLFATNAATIPIPTTNFTVITGTQLLLNVVNDTVVDQTGNQTFTAVGTAPSPFTISPFS